MASGVSEYSAEQKLERISDVPFWWHHINLGDGVVTPGNNFRHAENVMERRMPTDFRGKSVLDIGCWDGKYSFLAESRGADKVEGIDNGQQVEFVKSRYGMTIDPFLGSAVTKEVLGSAVDFQQADLRDVAETTDKYDVTLFFGVLYHQEDPMQALRDLHKLTKEAAVIESAVLMGPFRKGYKYYPDDGLNQDPTNWYVPSVDTLLEWVEGVGFSSVKLLGRHCLGTRAMVLAEK